MEKQSKYFVFLAIAIFVLGFTYLISFPNTFQREETNLPEHIQDLNDGDIYSLRINEEDFDLEVARTVDAKIQGLMERNELDYNSGMFFIFEESTPRTFHMRNVYVSLDMIFIDENFKVVKIHENTKVDQGEELYSSNLPAQYVIELAGGTAERIGLQEGDVLNISK